MYYSKWKNHKKFSIGLEINFHSVAYLLYSFDKGIFMELIGRGTHATILTRKIFPISVTRVG